MTNKRKEEFDLDEMQSAMTLQSALLMMLSVIIGVLIAGMLLPSWLPGLSSSLFGPEPKAYWYLSRGSALVSFAIVWFSMALGLMITNKMARMWPGGPVAFDLHQHTSLLGLAFALFHALILIGDKFINYTLPQIMVPFGSLDYKPVWVALGQLGFYLWAIVAFSFYLRGQMGTRAWRLVHFASYLVFGMVLVHGLTSGTDSGTTWALGMYWFTGGSLLFLTVYRILIGVVGKLSKAKPKPKPHPRPQQVEQV
jgi:predicted ferric reductase